MHAMLVTATPLHQPVSKATRALLRLIHAEVAKCVANGVLKGKVVAPGSAGENSAP
ncbi:hypothetical protein D3C71_2146290 [compost metagenome]